MNDDQKVLSAAVIYSAPRSLRIPRPKAEDLRGDERGSLYGEYEEEAEYEDREE